MPTFFENYEMTTHHLHADDEPEFQLTLFGASSDPKLPPSTRYQGSKYKLLDWLWSNISEHRFASVLDAFGGTGSVSYMLKGHRKEVTYNDYLSFNHHIGTALIENKRERLTSDDVLLLLKQDVNYTYDNFIERTFHDIYFTHEENQWLDMMSQNIARLNGTYKQAIAYYALFQSCISKRPYNLFHRKNLYMRTAEVKRGFGNKATWDKPFAEHFREFVQEANESVFDSGVDCKAVCHNALDIPGHFDLVYIDTPYINKKGVGVDYCDFYHFLEGITDYPEWSNRVNYNRKHHPLLSRESLWSSPKTVHEAFRRLLRKHADSILVVSYRSDGMPSEQELIRLISEVKRDVTCLHFGQYKYVLSTNTDSKELLLIGT